MLNFNRYAYCFGNPVRYADPTGEYATYSEAFLMRDQAVKAGYNLSNIYQSGNQWLFNTYEGGQTIGINSNRTDFGYDIGTLMAVNQNTVNNINKIVSNMTTNIYNSFNRTVNVSDNVKNIINTNLDFLSSACKIAGNVALGGSILNQPIYFKTNQITKQGKFIYEKGVTYSNKFYGNQYISSASVKSAKASFNAISKIASRTSIGFSALSFSSSYLNYKLGNISQERLFIQTTINGIGLLGPWGAGIAIGLGIVDSVRGDDIENWLQE